MEHIDCFGLTDPGKKRSENQDQFLIADLIKTMQINDTSLQMHAHSCLSGRSQGKLLVVADGMGGHAGGERASALAVETLNTYLLNTMHWLFRLEEHREQDFEQDLKAALNECDKAIRAEASAIPQERGMGTTITMAYLIQPRMYIVHAGDSRCYLLREGELRQLTTDHTIAEAFVEAGVLQPDEANTSRWSHVLWNVVGGNEQKLKPIVYKGELARGDVVLVCSDGLTRHVSNDELAEILDTSPTASNACERLVEAANDAGGTDNISVVVARC